MSDLHVIIIIVLVLGVIVSNLMVLKYTAKMHWPSKEELTDPVAKIKKQAAQKASETQDKEKE